MKELYIPVGVMRQFPTIELEIMPRLPVNVMAVNTQEWIAPTAYGYVPVYDSLEALRDEHGDVPYQVVRIKLTP